MSAPEFGFFQDLDTQDGDSSQLGSRLDLQFQPEGIENNHDSGMKVIAMPGHSHGLQQFAGGGEDAFSMKVHIIGDSADPDFVTDRVDWFKGLTFPEYDFATGALLRAPHTVLLVIGTWINERFKVASFKVSYGPTFDRVTRKPRFATVDLTLKRFNEVAIDYRQFRP